MEVIKSTKLGVLVFREVPTSVAKPMIVENHYSGKWNTSFGKVNVGVFRDDMLLGVAVFGNLMNPNSWRKIADVGPDGVLELNRLWISDELGHNAETLLLGASWRILRSEHPHVKAVQSFADGRLGVGTIYKASNFRYYGFSESLFFEDTETGEVFHKVPLENTKRPKGFLGKNRRYLDGKLRPFKVKTYRYIYPLYRNTKILLDERPYPEYEKGERTVEFAHPNSLVARLAVMYRAVGDSVYASKCEALVTQEDLEKAKNNPSVMLFLSKGKEVHVEP